MSIAHIFVFPFSCPLNLIRNMYAGKGAGRNVGNSTCGDGDLVVAISDTDNAASGEGDDAAAPSAAAPAAAPAAAAAAAAAAPAAPAGADRADATAAARGVGGVVDDISDTDNAASGEGDGDGDDEGDGDGDGDSAAGKRGLTGLPLARTGTHSLAHVTPCSKPIRRLDDARAQCRWLGLGSCSLACGAGQGVWS